MKRTYTELIQYSSFEDRLGYLMLRGNVGKDTFGFDRYLNQDFYRSIEWKRFRDEIILRDMGCDMALSDFPINDWYVRDGIKVRPKIIIHHLNPLVKEDILEHTNALFDPENVVCVSFATHNMIHYGHGDPKKMNPTYVERLPFDTSPWRKGVI